MTEDEGQGEEQSEVVGVGHVFQHPGHDISADQKTKQRAHAMADARPDAAAPGSPWRSCRTRIGPAIPAVNEAMPMKKEEEASSVKFGKASANAPDGHGGEEIGKTLTQATDQHNKAFL